MKKISIIAILLLILCPSICFGLFYYPNRSVVDQGSTSGRSVKNMVDAIGNKQETIVDIR